MLKLFIDLMERGLLPDWLVRFGVRTLCGQRLKSLNASLNSGAQDALRNYAKNLSRSELAQSTREANYEVPTEFFLSVLGSSRKYSCTYWEDAQTDLNKSEIHSLDITVERAEILDGMSILELGCGWGSLTLHMARKFPRSRILAVSNSATQREFILKQAADQGLKNVEVRTIDLSGDDSLSAIPVHGFDRVMSVEMFEHFKNYQTLLARVSRWLKPKGKLFVHIFTHREFSYPFETEGDHNWMGRYFFTGGQMPARDLLGEFQDDLSLEKQWDWSGTHYQKTADAWLKNLDEKREEVLSIFEKTYGRAEAKRWLERWRVFFMSCSELFGYKHGSEWGVSHYLFSQKR